MIKIYHSKELFISFRDDVYPVFPEEYELVAIVDTDDLEVAFHHTNHIDAEWWENEDVTCLKKTRSTSVGDVAINDETGEIFVCASCGWDKVGQFENVKP